MGKRKKDTKMRGCKFGCGERFWAERDGTCPKCRAVLAEIAADNQRAKRRPTPSPRVGAAYTRGLEMSRQMRQAMR